MPVGMTRVPAAMLEATNTRGVSVPSWFVSNDAVLYDDYNIYLSSSFVINYEL
jgi:hypothetical protein